MLENCQCKSGCPACIYSPKCGNDNKPLHKNATKYILKYMSDLISGDSEEVEAEVIIEDIELPDEFDEAYELYEKGNYSASKDVLNSIISADNRNARALALMAQILYEQDQKDIALVFTKKALSADRSNEMANELEVLLTNKPQKEHVELNSLDDVDTLYEEAYDLYEQGDLATSSEILEELLDFDDKNSEALALMGLIYYHSGIFPKAIEYYKKASKINKNGEMVKELKMRVS
jgi:DEAD/DEAH box helicase domain-containing protein